MQITYTHLCYFGREKKWSHFTKKVMATETEMEVKALLSFEQTEVKNVEFTASPLT